MLVGKLIEVDFYWGIIPGMLAMVAYGVMLFQLTASKDDRTSKVL